MAAIRRMDVEMLTGEETSTSHERSNVMSAGEKLKSTHMGEEKLSLTGEAIFVVSFNRKSKGNCP